MKDAIVEYARRHDAFLPAVAKQLVEYVASGLAGIPRIDRVSGRAKAPAKFAAKAANVDREGKPKYVNPLTEIQDQIGVRITVFYRQDVEPVTANIMRYFQPIEFRNVVPDSESEFAYFGKHLILPVPPDVVPKEVDLAAVPDFFELQIKTLFQHAWSEANHDLGYKVDAPLSPDQRRLLAYASAQAWGADRVFEELFSDLHGK